MAIYEASFNLTSKKGDFDLPLPSIYIEAVDNLEALTSANCIASCLSENEDFVFESNWVRIADKVSVAIVDNDCKYKFEKYSLFYIVMINILPRVKRWFRYFRAHKTL